MQATRAIRTFRLLFIVVSAAALACVAPIASAQGRTPPGSPAAGNLVNDGGFEKPTVHGSAELISAPGSIKAWTVSVGSVDLLRGRWQNFSGAQSIDLAGVSAGTIYQDLSTVPGVAYRVRFALAGNPEGGDTIKSVQVTFAGTTQVFTFDITGHNDGDMGWIKHGLTVVASGTVSRLQFESLNDGSYGPALDAVSVKPVGA